MKKGIRGHDVSAKGLEKIVSRCKALGYTELQLVLERSAEGFESGRFTEKYAYELKEKAKGIHIAVLGSYINPSATGKEEIEKELKKFKEKILYAQVLKPDVVGTETGFYGATMSDESNDTEEAYQYLLKNMKELVAEAERYDVNIGIEGVHCFVINSPEKMKRLIRDLNSSNVKVIFDPLNYLTERNYEKQDEIISKMFELLNDRIAVLHAKDFIIENGKIKPAMIGSGMLNYQLIFDNLKKYNLDIPIIAEGIDDEAAMIGLQKVDSEFGNISHMCSTDG